MADTIFINDAGLLDSLNSWKGGTQQLATGKLRIFKNNVTVSQLTALAALTEATAAGYAAITLASASWTAASVAAHVASIQLSPAAAFTFSAGAGSSAYGAYITDAGNTVLLCCWNFAGGPINIPAGGGTINVQPTLTSQSLN